MQSYYLQVKELIAPKLEFFKTDLTEHDRKSLLDYAGEFIHASRNSGTDLILFDEINNLKSFEWAVTFAIRSSNDTFLWGHNGRVKKITRERAIRIATAGARTTAARESAEKFPEYSDHEIMVKHYGRILPDYLRAVSHAANRN